MVEAISLILMKYECDRSDGAVLGLLPTVMIVAVVSCEARTFVEKGMFLYW